jgi:hypothetical protein
MLSAYFDESGTHRESSICVVAGLVASPDQWDRLTRSWQRVLDSASITDFHASDCTTGGGIFRGWSPKEREQLYCRFVDIIRRAVAFRVWTAVVMDDFHLHYDDKKEKLPYRLCAIGCGSRLRWLAMKRGSAFVIPYVFDQGEKGKWMYAAFDRLIAKRRGAYYYRMGSLAKGDRLSVLPLQAADLHAYEVYRYFADQMRTGCHEARRSFAALLTISDAGGYLMTGDNIAILNSSIGRQIREGTEEPIGIPVDRLTFEHGIKLTRQPEWAMKGSLGLRPGP